MNSRSWAHVNANLQDIFIERHRSIEDWTQGMSISRTERQTPPLQTLFLLLWLRKPAPPVPGRVGRGQISVLRSFTVPAGCLSPPPSSLPAKVCSTALV